MVQIIFYEAYVVFFSEVKKNKGKKQTIKINLLTLTTSKSAIPINPSTKDIKEASGSNLKRKKQTIKKETVTQTASKNANPINPSTKDIQEASGSNLKQQNIKHFFEVDKTRDKVIRENPDSGSDWSDKEDDENDENENENENNDVINIDTGEILRKKEEQLRQSLMVDYISKWLSLSHTHTHILTHIHTNIYTYIHIYFSFM